MIQSDKFDSSKMDIKKLSNSALAFIIKRLIEIFGFFVSVLGFCILIALISYSPEDPNFIFPKNTEIRNDSKSLYIFSHDNKFRLFLKGIMDHPYFENFILYLIGLNSLMLYLQEPSLTDEY